MTETRPAPTTTDAGTPAPSDEHSLSVGPGGPLLLQDHHLLQKMARFDRERVPERVVHAKGGGAYGVFEVTDDVSEFTKAVVFRPGARTDVLVRFSSVVGEMGSADTVRDPRGFAVKFSTEHGNYDIVGNNTPIFFVPDPQKFRNLVHSQERRADGHTRDNNVQWDFWTLSPESAHQVTLLMTDRGTPRTWRHMHGYGGHTFLWYNADGTKYWVKYHFKTDQGIETFTSAEATAMAADDPDHHLRDLFTSIRRREFPSWTLYVQVMPFEEAADYRFNPFDLTKVWPHGDYPLIRVGRMTLDRNPQNHVAEIAQAAFEPANFVPGIGPSPDKVLQGRLFGHPDAHRYRIGANYLQLPVNRPKSPVASSDRNGRMRYADPTDPVSAPNGAGGPVADPDLWKGASYYVGGEILRSAYVRHPEDDDYGQPRALWEKVLSDDERAALVSNIGEHAGAPEVTAEMKPRIVAYWRNVHPDLGDRVAAGLGCT